MIFRIRLFVAQLLGTLAFNTSRLLKKGSGEQIQGRVIDALCPNALAHFARDKKIIIVSSTNGKTTTTRLIFEGLTSQYDDVITNALGANQKAGVLAALVNGHKCSDQYAVLEIDERSLPSMYDDLAPAYVVFTNLSRDQLDRFGEVASISTAWKKMLLNTSAHFIANGSDPHIVFATSDITSSQIEYIVTPSLWHDDAHTCPQCGNLITWESDDHFSCPACSFSVPDSAHETNPAIQSRIADSLQIPGQWNVTNATFAYATLKQCQVEDEAIFASWKNVLDVSGRNAIFQLDEDRTLQLLLAKNPAGWNEMLHHVSQDPDSGLIFAFNCNIADGKDPSWLYDVDFENSTHADVVVFGERATDMQVRLDVAGKNVAVAHSLNDAIAKTSKHPTTYLIASYTQFLTLSRTLPKMSHA